MRRSAWAQTCRDLILQGLSKRGCLRQKSKQEKLSQVASINLRSRKHEARRKSHTPVKLPHELFFFLSSTLEVRVKSTIPLVACPGIDLCDNRPRQNIWRDFVIFLTTCLVSCSVVDAENPEVFFSVIPTNTIFE